ncbi:predicted protein [Chaetomium globosum CBS 148.51]|uniref:Uncharacterized protein n=1 Tax=Chaetomium globosum (strain ATCC 6205 / CBS 148.51 / DSM 1962 / NBRC 6347 / NRRL 1970) TaxID=306901 RepID=Q2GPE5_CHAGB|nr:uncharacterized protein CHGG_10159 [Chaetomium globosum CBS 148.51]EAQ83755.1 predicted protein [Chaetomium globosum CBS 148.51]
MTQGGGCHWVVRTCLQLMSRMWAEGDREVENRGPTSGQDLIKPIKYIRLRPVLLGKYVQRNPQAESDAALHRQHKVLNVYPCARRPCIYIYHNPS